MKTMYALTHIDSDGMRTLTRRNWGQNHFETREAGEKYLEAFLNPETNRESTLIEIFGKRAIGTFKICPIECYDHGDAISVYVDEPPVFES